MTKSTSPMKSMPSTEIPFKFTGKGKITKKSYNGDFLVKVPRVRDMSRIGIELARLNEGVPLEYLDQATANLNNAIAFLKVTVLECPDWFSSSDKGMDFGMETLDYNIPIELFRQADKVISDWQKQLMPENE